MKLSELRAPRGSKKKRRRVGRGPGSGRGKTSGRGHKGQKSRAGSKKNIGFEGGQMPLIRRLPKRGFRSKFPVIWQEVNVERLNQFKDNEVIDLKKLKEKGIIKTLKRRVKVLGKGELKVPLTVRAHKFSKSAKEKIEKAKGKVEVIKGYD
jgi:large subunit ribosomal protein L15